jgi:serine/tyrosine/threonine adenylyltransferase
MPLAASLDDLLLSNSFAALPPDFYTRLKPQGLTAPRLLHANEDAAALLGLDPGVLGSEAFLRVFAGLDPLPGGDTLAAVYSGHQFGVWAGQLGDGRAHLLGEVRGPQGNWELQLKGAGLTPYSRMGDGRAVLRSSVREYLASEAMHGLGIPTTRALALVVSDDPVVRETVETAAIVTRMAPSFVRFGSFEHWASQRQPELLRQLADYVIDQYYPACREAGEGGAPYLALLREVIGRTARLMAQWQLVGFCHGVMNTDNMSILGLTLDYGPYGFMDAFRLDHVCNHSDTQGRYAWNRQPSVALWNLYRLGGALNVLIDDVEAVKAELGAYEAQFTTAFHDGMAAKLGIGPWRPDDEALLDGLLKLMHDQRADFTLTFRRLSDALQGQTQPFLDLYMDRESAAAWLQQWSARQESVSGDRDARAKAMNRINPLYVLRNHLAENAIRAAREGDTSVIVDLLRILKDPFDVHAGAEIYASLPPDWASDLEVSCSS